MAEIGSSWVFNGLDLVQRSGRIYAGFSLAFRGVSERNNSTEKRNKSTPSPFLLYNPVPFFDLTN
jgi:hypothetical protein